MIVYCDCLNVKIEIEGNDFHKVTLDILNLNNEELNDSFFQKVSLNYTKIMNFLMIYCLRILFN